MNDTRKKKKASRLFAQFAMQVAKLAGRPHTFALAALLVVVWALTGPVFAFNQTWQLVINTGTTIITFLMVFVLQNAQTRDTAAVQAKLDEIILKTSNAENRFVGIEKLDDEELERLERKVVRAARRRDGSPASRKSGSRKTSGSRKASASRKKTSPRSAKSSKSKASAG